MNAALRIAFGFAFFLFGGLAAPVADAAGVVGDAALVYPDPDLPPHPSDPDAWLVLTRSIPEGEGLFSVSITEVAGGDFLFRYNGIAECYALYAAESGMFFGPDYVATATPLVENCGPVASSIVTFAPDESRYFAYWDDRSAWRNYGWVRLTRTAASLAVDNSATKFGEGIVVGNTIVPEPARGLFAAAGIAAAVLRRRRALNRTRDHWRTRS